MLRRALGIEEEGAGDVAVPRATGVARTLPAICRPELKTNWLPVPFGQKPPPMVDEFVESTPMLPLDELRPRYTRLTVMAPSVRANRRKPRGRAPGSGFAAAVAGMSAANASASNPPAARLLERNKTFIAVLSE